VTVGYSGTPLPRKLGIKPGHRVLVAHAPPGFVLDDAPAEVHRRAGRQPYDVQLVFTPDRRALTQRFAAAQARMTVDGALWIAWPKRASGVATDLGDDVVREHGLAGGLVDVKVCAVDATWSAIKFVVRLRDR
jgi:hypothetical protein